MKTKIKLPFTPESLSHPPLPLTSQHLPILIHCSAFTHYSLVVHSSKILNNEIIKDILFGVCFLSLSMLVLKFRDTVAYISSLFLFTAEYYSTAWIYHNLFTRLPIDRRLDCHQFRVLMNKAAVNIGTEVLLCTRVFISFGKVPRNRIARSYGRWMLYFI